jgi:serine/threonine protein kinase
LWPKILKFLARNSVSFPLLPFFFFFLRNTTRITMPYFSNESIKNTGKVLGSGAKGTVYLGFDEEGGRFVAIKELDVTVPMEFYDDEALLCAAPSSGQRAGVASNESMTLHNSDQQPFDLHQHHHNVDDDDARVAMIRAIQNEVELLERAARHDHIVSYYGSMITAEHRKLALVMEYVSGGSLASIIRRQKGLRDSVVRAYGRDVLLGLQYLHEVCRMCHRDIKPDNILVTPEGRCKLADFGASRALERTTLLKTCVGTPYYMAPEVVQGEGYDESADIWSFGATIFEMASGKPPFADISNGMAVMFRVATLGRLPDIPIPNSTSSSSSSSVNPLLADVVRQCCQMPKSARPTAAALLQHPFFTAGMTSTIPGGSNVATAPVTSSVAAGRAGAASAPAAEGLSRASTPPPPDAAGTDAEADFPFFQQKNLLDDVHPSRRCGRCNTAIALFSCDACDAAEMPSGAGCTSKFCPPCWSLSHAHQRALGHVKRPLLISLVPAGGPVSSLSSRTDGAGTAHHPHDDHGHDADAVISNASVVSATATVAAAASTTPAAGMIGRMRSLSSSATSAVPPPPRGQGVRISTKHPQDGGVLLPDGTFVDLLSRYDEGGEQSEWTCGRCSSINDGPLTECDMCGYER